MNETIHTDVENGVAHREFAAELTPGDGRTIDVRIVPYGERIQHDDGLGGVPRGELYTEEVMPGAFAHQLNAANRVVANYEHHQGIGGVVGRGLALRDEPDGFHGTFTMLKTAHGDAALELVREGVLDGVSLEARFKRSVRSAEGVVQRFKADLYAIAFTRFGAYKGAKVLAVREEAEQVIDEQFMPLDLDPELAERCRRLGVAVPQRYEAHPADTPPVGGTSEATPAETDDNNESSEE